MSGIDEKTYAELQEIAARYPEKRSGLLPMLHLVQSVEGRVTPAGIEACAEILEITPAEVSGGMISSWVAFNQSPCWWGSMPARRSRCV